MTLWSALFACRGTPAPSSGTLDWISLAYIAVALAASGWPEGSARTRLAVAGGSRLLPVFVIGMYLGAARPASAVSFCLLRDRNLAFGCAISFILGIGLFGSVYLLPVFLAFVHAWARSTSASSFW